MCVCLCVHSESAGEVRKCRCREMNAQRYKIQGGGATIQTQGSESKLDALITSLLLALCRWDM